MRTLFFVITLTLLAFGSAAHATELNIEKPNTHVSKCPKGKCDAFIERRSSGPIPYDGGTICSTIVQDFRGGREVQMMIKFFDGNDRELDANDVLHTKRTGAVGRICPGRHWFEKALASGGYVKFCNEDGHVSILRAPQIEACLDQGTCTPLKTNYVCLLGKEGCKEAGRIAAERLSSR